MNAILNYPGAKWGLAKTIVELMPKHRSYLEPFFGSGAVLFNKPPSSIETVNDLDGDIINFFTVLRECPQELAEKIALTPYSREVFDDAHENRGTDAFDKAYRFAIRSRMGHGFKTYQKTGFKIDVYARERSYCVDAWNRMPRDILSAAERLKCVQIENRPAVELLEVLRTHKGYVILSGYPSELYDRELRDWIRLTKRSYNQNCDARTEVIWCNFDTLMYQMSEDYVLDENK